MNIGRTFFYDKTNGEIIVDTGEWQNAAKKKSIEEYIDTYVALSERNRSSFDYISLNFGQYAKDFMECDYYRVNTKTKELEFSYPNPNELSSTEPEYVAPLSEQISANMDYLLDIDFRLIMVELGVI